MMPQEKSFATQAAMMFLAVTLTFIAVIGNGSFVAIFARFKVFRNFPNTLFANLALIDFLNALINVPLFAMYFVLQTSWLTGKTWTIISSSLNLEFALLNLVFMSVLMLDRFLAVYLDLKYFTWKTPKKAKITVFLMWLVCTILVALSSVPLFGMDFEGEPLIVSRIKIFRERKLVVASLMALSTITSTVLGMLTNYFIHQKKKQVRKCIYYGKMAFKKVSSNYCALAKDQLRATTIFLGDRPRTQQSLLYAFHVTLGFHAEKYHKTFMWLCQVVLKVNERFRQ